MSRPIGRLVGAAQRVGDGELETQVLEEEGDDEIAQLSVYFNKMTRQLKGQRDRLLENTAQIRNAAACLIPFCHRSPRVLLDWMRRAV